MGCLCSKEAPIDQFGEVQQGKGAVDPSKPLVSPSKRGQLIGENAKPNEQSLVPPTAVSLNEREKNFAAKVERKSTSHQRRATVDIGVRGGGARGGDPSFRLGGAVPNGVAGEHVAAGWPSWLTAVAAEAVSRWLPRKADSFEKLEKIGQGTYSSVYRACDLETGKIVAMKQVRFVNTDPESVRFMAREINILRRLDHPNVLKLEALVTSRMSNNLYLVFEYMDHDLAGLAATPGRKFTEPQVKCFVQQLLRGLEHCHSHGVLHRDVKGSNLLVDSNGILRIADFGLSTLFHPDNRQPLTSRVVTLWYRPPELLLGATYYGVAVDLWSAGCILAELLAGKPIMPGRTEVEQMHKIFKLCGSPSEDYWRRLKLQNATLFRPQHPYRRCVAETFKDFPSSALALLEVLLAIDPEDRGTASSALKSEFFTTKPLPSNPSSLPKFPPSKEYDAKLRNEEARRERAESVKGRGAESVRRGPRQMAPPDASVHVYPTFQKTQAQENPKSTSSKYNPQEDTIGTAHNNLSHSGASQSSGNRNPREGENVRPAISSTMGSSVAGKRYNTSKGSESVRSTDRYSQLDVAEPSAKQEWTSSTNKQSGKEEATVAYRSKKNRINYSGPLLPPGGNIDDMLKEHERHIQEAVRKSRLDKAKTNNNFD
ncbi:putative serine/threonine-protein kinase [Cinnamomum micranthum f. kanehirae]|uniref:Putative serine/threonine-protein kinase n=1 Tax=Cinnamomum micranthum f. kanehirae TaxID=337451 RepID=A0A443N058_9MAGN|nr:putative serine/threonine-protein kinase [Cinnamomum micranthum f. kanehirae]